MKLVLLAVIVTVAYGGRIINIAADQHHPEHHHDGKIINLAADQHPVHHHPTTPRPDKYGKVFHPTEAALESTTTTPVEPPPHDQHAKVARYVAHVSDYAHIATISTRAETSGQPFSNVVSIADGKKVDDTGAGIPYMYMTEWGMTTKDLASNPHFSLSMVLAQTDYCQRNNYDPQSPLCNRLALNGKLVRLEKGSEEEAMAKDYVWGRHPEMETWPENHDWFFCKMEISTVQVWDWTDGTHQVEVADYLTAYEN